MRQRCSQVRALIPSELIADCGSPATPASDSLDLLREVASTSLLNMTSTDGPPWTQTWLGRTLNTGLGLAGIIGGLDRLFNHPGWRPIDVALSVGALVGAGTLLLLLAWTERLFVRDGELVAHHFWGEKSVRLIDISDATDPMFVAGILVRTQHGQRLKSWVTMCPTTYLWTPRSTRVAATIKEIAAEAQASVGTSHIKD